MVELLLDKAHRVKLAQAFRHVPRVDLSIECVVEGQMGKAFGDDPDQPAAYEIAVGPFAYFAGDATSAGGREIIKNIAPWTLIMPSGTGWTQVAQSVHGDRLIAMDRYSFSSDGLSVEYLDRVSQKAHVKMPRQRMDLAFLESLHSQDRFVDISDFDSPEDFVQRGVGFYAETSRLAGVAYSSLVCSRGIEVSIFVVERYRRQGVATALACHLLRWCLQNGMDAHWDAANLPSYGLAQKLGYRATGAYRAYYLQGDEL